MDNIFDISGKVAIITGGAGGVGRAIASAFAERGASVVVTSRDLNKLESVANQIRSTGHRAVAIGCDVADEKSVDNMVDQVKKEFSRIDILVNTAGINIRNLAINTTAEEWLNVIKVNSLGTFLCCKAVAKVMIPQKSGKIINISSVRGRFGSGGGPAGSTAYGPSKGAIDTLTRSLAAEWGCYNINVNALAPSLIKTDLTKGLLADPEKAKKVISDFSLGRLAELSDIVGPAVFLASNAASFITGQIIYIDGGNTSCFMQK